MSRATVFLIAYGVIIVLMLAAHLHERAYQWNRNRNYIHDWTLQCPYCGYRQSQDFNVGEHFSFGPGRCPLCHRPVWTGTTVQEYDTDSLEYMEQLQANSIIEEVS